jgi:glycosyltransferase involved in cell wall biosynthesis
VSGLRPHQRPLFERLPLLLYGILFVLVGLGLFVTSSPIVIAERLLGGQRHLDLLGRLLYDAGGVFLWSGALLGAIDLFVLLPFKRMPQRHHPARLPNRGLTVALTAYNDEPSIGEAVRDFRAHPLVRRVLVVDNNSKDATARVAAEAGATVIHEPHQGYGHCVFRALTEGSAYDDTVLTLLCEGDMTFRAHDIDKFMAYMGHADIVNGTRIVEQLRSRKTQLTTFMYYGNFFVGKLLEARHVGKGTYTDVGTTYKLCWNPALKRLLPLLNPAINLEFNAHFLDTALARRLRVLECPVTFHARVGVSKGGNVNNLRALGVGLRMIRGIVFGWPRKRSQE